jgi:hypothetical protein
MADNREPQDWFGGHVPIQGETQPQPAVQQSSATPARPGVVRRRWTGVGLAAAGLVAGGVLAGTLGASAATGSSSPAATSGSGASSGSSVENAPDTDPAGEHGPGPGHGHGLDLSGSVTAVGTSSVTIKTSSATTTYAVSSSSDIDKNGESQLNKLVVGDAVTFSTTTSGSTVSIDKLHAGNEALNRPQERNTSG